jgi:hypothetical protein
MAKQQTTISYPLARSENVVVESVGDETVIYDVESHVAHALMPLAAAVYAYADGKNTAAEIAELAAYRLDTTVTEADVLDAVAQLEAISMLSSPVLDVNTGLSRRQALKTFAAAGAGSMLVLSVATSAASASATCTSVPSNANGTCTKNAMGSAGPGGCNLCAENSQCGSDQVCCCTPCDGASTACCQPVCFWKSTTEASNGYCPVGTLPLTTKVGSIVCPTGYAQYDSNGYQVKCCEVGCPSCRTERNGVCCDS